VTFSGAILAAAPVSPLVFSGKPLFFTAFTNPEEFLRVNNLQVQPRRSP
jgi:hypothetical protein